ncbi:TBC1 domain family member 22B [Araneus ventricosus]|uniref:TBC1 domain family member 22B n=1 Tax=Araneus ventricosus TaxID=182803 RepID=A0A4Y2CU76_ARAVE|nr:TBC1 domain family member 22B [Araneus ventricosus]
MCCDAIICKDMTTNGADFFLLKTIVNAINLFLQAFERILYILAIRHPASGYVQGMNDLVTPFFVVFLQDFIPAEADVESYDVSQLSSDALQQVEADSYWCMAKLLDGIQDNYTFAQPGIQKKVHMLKELIQRIDG